MKSSNSLIVILSGVLVAALLAAGAVIFLLPGDTATSTTSSIVRLISRLNIFSADNSPDTSQPQVSDFNVTPLQRNSYTELNTTFITNGSIPVRPDPAAGKANPFL